MLLEGETSITKWAWKLRDDKKLSNLSGWQEGKSPSIGTFYTFIDRLQDGPYTKCCEHRQKLSQMDKGKHLRNFKDKSKKDKSKKDNDNDKTDSITNSLAEFFIANTAEKRQNDFLKRLEDILIELAIKPSIDKGLIDTQQLIVAGDGSSIKSGANKHGKHTCNCFKKTKNRRCDCPRTYTDPDADWGYDSYNKVFYYGDTFYQICYSVKGHDLPLHIHCGPASETDFTLSLKSFDRFLKSFKEHDIPYSIPAAIFDAGHDAMGNYFYFQQKNIPTIIPLNNRGAKNSYKNKVALSENAIPLCKAGLEMRHLGYSKKRMRHQYGCPVKRPTHRDGKHYYISYPDECPLKSLCVPGTTVAPVVTIYSRENIRLFSEIPRNSPKFKELYNLRTGTERSNSFKKHAYPIHRARLKSRAKRLIWLYLLAVIEHWKAIFKEETKGLSREQIKEKLFK